MRRVLIADATVLALAGCGGVEAAQPTATESSAPDNTSAPTTSTEAPNRDALLLEQVCRTF